jgi:hypothetical protein
VALSGKPATLYAADASGSHAPSLYRLLRDTLAAAGGFVPPTISLYESINGQHALLTTYSLYS